MAVVGRTRCVSPSPAPVRMPKESLALVCGCDRSSAPVWMRSLADTADVEYASNARGDWERDADSYTMALARHIAHAIIRATTRATVHTSAKN